ncbi:helix-turn-helix transcriptional regulator [Granulosicoccaceae sp. 1_MG-2023]|nr:helix-turn-helix transcriptional regulator [Granulosicoccaceae sp. 1_MG-2023]
MSEFLTTREVAQLLRVKERKVYDLAARGKIPCSRATGKLLFPREDIENWIIQTRSGPGPASTGKTARPAVLLGSHDPLLEWALRESGCGIATFFDGSLDGIDRYLNGEGIATAMHLFDAPGKSWNIQAAGAYLGAQNIALMEWAGRSRGLIISPHCDKPVTGIDDIRGLSVVSRQPGAGSQQLLNHLLDEAGISREDFNSYPAQRTETDAVMPLLQGKADVCLGLAAIAEQYKLAYVPLVQERFDIAVDRHFWFGQSWQTLLTFCRSNAFQDKAKEFGGYDVSQLGKIWFNAD